MSVVITVLIVLACVVAYLFCGLLGIRLSDKISGGRHGLDPEDRGLATSFALLFGPLYVSIAAFILLCRRVAEIGWVHDFTHPQKVQTKKREEMKSQLLQEHRKYEELRLEARREGRRDEAELFGAVANDYYQKAYQ